MPRKYDMWTHGTSVQVQEKGWEARAVREGYSTKVTPGNDLLFGWVHFAIPTPVMIDSAPLKAQVALIRFNIGSQASIEHFQVFNGEGKIIDRGVKYPRKRMGRAQSEEEPIQDQPVLIGGVGISIKVVFTGRDRDAWIELIGAGIQFFS